MPVLADLLDALRTGAVEVVALTAPLHSGTPILQLPPPFANASPFSLTEISNFDERGPAWYWNDIATSEHTGTHFDAPVHWITGRGGEDVSQVPPASLIGPAAALACTAAIETEIDRHYGAQLDALGDADPELSATIAEFRAEEVEHRDIALSEGAEDAPAYPVLSGAIRLGCRLAIALSQRV